MENETKKIVFYSASPPSIFIYKIARLFYRKGYKTILVTMCEKEAIDLDFYQEAFDEIIFSNFQFFKPSNKTLFYLFKRGWSFIRFLIRAKMLRPYVVIGSSGANWQLKFFHRFFFKKYPFIYFPYDILSLYFNSNEEALQKGVKAFELDAEKYCLENSEGILHKGSPHELDFFKSKNYSLPKLQLDFSTYSSKEFSVSINKKKLSKKDKEIHIVYIGFFFNDEESVKIINKIFNEILSQGLHLHIYATVKHIPKNQADIYFNDLFNRFKGLKYFHIHSPLGPKEIIREISKYDYALWPNTLNPNLPDNKYHTGNKFASYLEAGIPMLYSNQSIYINTLMKHYGLGKLSFGKNINGLKKSLKKLNYKELERKTIKAREDFDMDKNFPRLEKFIEETVASKNSSAK